LTTNNPYDAQVIPTPEHPLTELTWDLDRAEGQVVTEMRDTHTSPYPEPLLNTPDDLDRNVAVTSLDTLLISLLYNPPECRFGL
jgi:hypothetical protein